ncbi:carbohydrate ABC transporter permease [uncultured Alsobacter sp.]|uniref:carbohydrate ABC transporter permease n=1 Tax=uncultured Alsobacter sp. TaxID=1748258 RepID=UPI0025F75320|nr:sugar ABC transporter permease [uncultured Alsobacter sp.]
MSVDYAAMRHDTAAAPLASRRVRPGSTDRKPSVRGSFGLAVLFLLPSLLGLTIFLIGPLVASLVLSFTNWQVIGTTRFVGFTNYVNLLTIDPIFWKILRTTLLYTAEYLVLNIVLSLTIAVWISRLAWGKTIFRIIFFLPTFMPLVGVALVWLLILTPGGVFDWMMAGIGLKIPNLVTNADYALQAVVLVSLWSHFGYNMLLFGAALESVPQSYLDAAAIDGATAWQQFWRIKLPLISPSLFFGTVLTAINSLQTFDQVYALTHGGPGSATTTLGYAIYSQGFVTYKLGYASAIAWVLFAIIMMLTALQLHLQKKWVHYEI